MAFWHPGPIYTHNKTGVEICRGGTIFQYDSTQWWGNHIGPISHNANDMVPLGTISFKVIHNCFLLAEFYRKAWNDSPLELNLPSDNPDLPTILKWLPLEPKYSLCYPMMHSLVPDSVRTMPDPGRMHLCIIHHFLLYWIITFSWHRYGIDFIQWCMDLHESNDMG